MEDSPPKPSAVMDPDPRIFVVDDDDALRECLDQVLSAAGYRVETFALARDFLARERHDGPACLVLDVYLPDLDGLELQQILAASDYWLPIVFLTGRGDIPMSVRAMKAGAVDFLSKPFDRNMLIPAIEQALEYSRLALRQAEESALAKQLLEKLTPREKETLRHLLTGQLNKQIAADLGISETTVKIHRSRVMHKMHVHSVTDLVRLVEKAILPPHRAAASLSKDSGAT